MDDVESSEEEEEEDEKVSDVFYRGIGKASAGTATDCMGLCEIFERSQLFATISSSLNGFSHKLPARMV